MKSRIAPSIILAGAFLSSVSAADFDFFGHLGGFYSKGLGVANGMHDYKDDKTKKADYAGVSAQIGVDAGFGDLHIGIAGWGAFPVYGSPQKIDSPSGDNYAQRMYTTDYADLSDLYIKYDSDIQIAVGRFDNDFLGSDWIVGHTQGVGAKWDTKYFGAWATWVNDATTFGYQPNRFGSELSRFNRYHSSFNRFNVGDRDLFAGGIDIDLDFLKINPFVHYWLGGDYGLDGVYVGNHPMLQAGSKFALEFGNDRAIKSITSLRFLWQNIIDVNKDDTTLLWLEEELRFKNMIKVGAGWYSVGGNNGLYTLNDRSRFYGWRYLSGAYDHYYFGRAQSSWYAFAGLESEEFNFDLLYADGDYKEFSAIIAWNIFQKDDLGFQIGGGYVSNGFQSKAYQQNNAVVFAKLSF
ncbi:hypothetical protein BKH46_06225 [Helicobacter sp. 12S02634-8]|uniref:hypothetical protein n=1 Tax=Helicobacter sp. 12S02634-8 TaxID=1476199 RepID=UPI000BA61421|nr:hypothetical protein [Helicobacter sp. 12S02634-8]PAF46809.1 hypothetical protein BKH46_06225 [Helicobacter sp. 12S02634-8]